MNTRKKIIFISVMIVALVVMGLIAYGVSNGRFSSPFTGADTALSPRPSSVASSISPTPPPLSPRPSSLSPRPSSVSTPTLTPTSTSSPTHAPLSPQPSLSFTPTPTLTFTPTSTPTSTSTPPVSSDTISPVVKISSPVDGAKNIGRYLFFFSRHYMTINSSATDNIKVVRMELYIDGAIKSSVAQSSISYNWDVRAASKGSHVIQVKAYDAAGNIGLKTITVYK